MLNNLKKKKFFFTEYYCKAKNYSIVLFFIFPYLMLMFDTIIITITRTNEKNIKK